MMRLNPFAGVCKAGRNRLGGPRLNYRADETQSLRGEIKMDEQCKTMLDLPPAQWQEYLRTLDEPAVRLLGAKMCDLMQRVALAAGYLDRAERKNHSSSVAQANFYRSQTRKTIGFAQPIDPIQF